MLSYKSLVVKAVKDVDVKQGIVTGYFSAFGNVDSGSDMIMKGAFKDSLVNDMHRIKHLWQHDSNTPIGKITMLKEDDYGLYFESKLSKSDKGVEASILYEEGIINEHSIGYQEQESEKKTNEKGDTTHWELTKLKLWEGSTVTWGMNEMALMTEVKSKDALLDRISKLERILKSNGLLDDTYKGAEIALLELNKIFNK